VGTAWSKIAWSRLQTGLGTIPSENTGDRGFKMVEHDHDIPSRPTIVLRANKTPEVADS